MLDKLNIVKQRFDEISDLIIQPDIDRRPKNATSSSTKSIKTLKS